MRSGPAAVYRGIGFLRPPRDTRFACPRTGFADRPLHGHF